MVHTMKWELRTAIGLVSVVVGALVVFPNLVIARKYDRFIFDSVDSVPPRDVALVLGTAKYTNGRVNLYYSARIAAAFELYEHKKIRKILVSGDNSRRDYNEPLEMKNDLMAMGVPENDIHLDFAGFRTLDSIIRAREVFGLEDFIIVSQRFHTERALFIARSRNIDAVGFVAKDVNLPIRYKVLAREIFARVRAGLDVFILNKGPKYLGPKIPISQQG
jgi:SanA protein